MEEQPAPLINQIAPLPPANGPVIEGEFEKEAKENQMQEIGNSKHSKDKELMGKVMQFGEAGSDANRNAKRYVETQFIPVELARTQILKMEDDMKKMHDRHLKLMKEVDENYKLIEEETQEHFSEFLDKWKKLAKSKIDQYKAAFQNLKSEKEDIQTRLQAIVNELQEKNKKLVDDYEKLLEKYHKDLESEKKQHKDKVELMESTYEEELSKLKQEKIELEGLLEAMKSQKETYEQKSQELRMKMKEKEVGKRDQIDKIVQNYAMDCAKLVMANVVSEVEARDAYVNSENRNRTQRREIDNLKQNVTKLERERETLRDQVKKGQSVAFASGPEKKEDAKVISKKSLKLVAAVPDEGLPSAPAPFSGDHKRYDELVIEKHRITKKIIAWKKEFEQKEGRKCEKADCQPIREWYRDLKRVNEELQELRGQKLEDGPGVNDSIVSIGSEGGRSKSLSPKSKGKQTPKGDRSFTNAVGSMAEMEELKQENRNLKDELQKVRLTMAGKVEETDAIKQLKGEIDALKKDKEQWRVKFQELASKTGKDVKRDKELNDDMEQLRKENTKLQEKLYYFKNRAQTMAIEQPQEKASDTFKQEYEKMLTENQELQKQAAKLEPLQIKVIETEAKLQGKEKDCSEIKEKYDKIVMERLALGKQVLKLKELEAERLKIRAEVINDPSKPGQEQVLKELAKEQELLKAQNAQLDEDLKNSNQKVAKLTKENEELMEKYATLKKFENSANELEIAQQKLADAERESGQLRLSLAMGLPEAPEDKNSLIKGDYEKVVADNKALKDRIEQLQKKLALLKDIKKNYDDKVQEAFQLRQEIKKLQIDNDETSKKAETVGECKTKIADLRMQLADKLPSESSKMRQEMRKVVEENKDLQTKADTSDDVNKTAIQYKALAETANAELNKLRQDLKKVEIERDGLRAKADKSTTYMMERNSLRVQLAKLSKTEEPGVQMMGGEAGAYKAEMSRLLAENEKLLKNVEMTDKVKKDNVLKEERIKDLEGKLKASKDRVKELEQQLSKNVESKTKESMEKLKADNKDLEKQLEKERLASKALKIEVDKVTKKYDTLREKEVHELEEKIKKLEDQHKKDIALFEKTTSEEMGKRGKELETAKGEITKLTGENAALLASVKELENKSKVLSQNVHRLESELAKIGAEASRAIGLQEQVEKLTNQIEKEKTDYVVMEKKYKDEMLQRKRLHNIIEDMKGKIRVFCRVRPLSEKEKEMGSASIVNIVDEFTVKVDTKYGPKAFSFDAAFSPDISQDKVFEDTKRLIQSAVDGYNVCIFAYGQTGAGKTFTIQGSDSNPGIAPRSFEELDTVLHAMNNYSYSVECYMVELYLDTMSDLLLPKDQRKNPPKLDIKEDIKGMMFVHAATKLPITCSADAKKIFDTGLNNRKTFATEMNDASSRSHLVFSILIETINKQTNQRALGKISFVDLAGSERATKAGTSTERLKEGRAINKSLSALGDVISILSSGTKAYVPYRNNKLTMLMKDSIGGNAKTLMFVNISPAEYNMEETVTTLVYGSRAKMITNDTQKNVETRLQSRMNEAYKKMQVQLELAVSALKTNNIAVPTEINIEEVPKINVEELKDEKPEDITKMPEFKLANEDPLRPPSEHASVGPNSSVAPNDPANNQ